MSSTPDCATFLRDLFRRLAERGWTGGIFLDALADDLTWTVTGTSPVSGTYRGKDEYVAKVFRPLDERLETWPRPVVERIIADGDWATVLFDSQGGRGKNGTDYSMLYCWIMRVVDEKIHEVVGFYDQNKVAELFA